MSEEEERRMLRQALAAEEASAESKRAALREATAFWMQQATMLQEFLDRPELEGIVAPRDDKAPGGFADEDVLREAAKWHAEARQFAAEARKVERSHQQATRRREAEREGWLDFQAELKRMGRNHLPPSPGAVDASREQDAAMAAKRRELHQLRMAIDGSRAESERILNTEASIRKALDEAGRRMQSLKALTAELEANLM